MSVTSAHLSPICRKSFGSEKIQSEVVSVEHFDSERGREIGFEECQVFFLDAFDSGYQYFRFVFEPLESSVLAIPIVRSGFRHVHVRRDDSAEFRVVRESFREHVERIYGTYGELLVRDGVRFDIAEHRVIPVSVVPSDFRQPFFREGRDKVFFHLAYSKRGRSSILIFPTSNRSGSPQEETHFSIFSRPSR